MLLYVSWEQKRNGRNKLTKAIDDEEEEVTGELRKGGVASEKSKLHYISYLQRILKSAGSGHHLSALHDGRHGGSTALLPSAPELFLQRFIASSH